MKKTMFVLLLVASAATQAFAESSSYKQTARSIIKCEGLDISGVRAQLNIYREGLFEFSAVLKSRFHKQDFFDIKKRVERTHIGGSGGRIYEGTSEVVTTYSYETQDFRDFSFYAYSYNIKDENSFNATLTIRNEPEAADIYHFRCQGSPNL